MNREKGYLEQAAEAVGGDGFDVIIENASDINLGSDLTVIGPGARIVVSAVVLYGERVGFPTLVFPYRLWEIEETLKSALVF